LNVNGSFRSLVESLEPASYHGVDIMEGPGVDEVCPGEKLISRFGEGRFDLVISTEMLEHTLHWKKIIKNLKAVVKPGGILMITTRSQGFPYHGYPFDFWRYEISDAEVIFSDFSVEALEKDGQDPGIFLKARKLPASAPADLGRYRLYSMPLKRRATIPEAAFSFELQRIRRQMSSFLPSGLKRTIKSCFGR